jgi:O-acetyl-ADP-ribose deacetylase (regulator of RNase III)
MIEIVSGSLIDAKEKYIVHQTNCVTNRAAHLAQTVFKAFPFADIYTSRVEHDKPGTIIVRGNGKDQRYVINMLGQVFPGKPHDNNYGRDTALHREKYFHRCLGEIAKIENLETVALPHHIGCGAAGGNWTYYYDLITRFANYVAKTQNARVILYKLAGLCDERS